MDLKQFWDNQEHFAEINGKDVEFIKAIRKHAGYFHWERGGKQFVKYCSKIEDKEDVPYTVKQFSKVANNWIGDRTNEDLEWKTNVCLNAYDFLDCLACLGEEKVKELILALK